MATGSDVLTFAAQDPFGQPLSATRALSVIDASQIDFLVPSAPFILRVTLDQAEEELAQGVGLEPIDARGRDRDGRGPYEISDVTWTSDHQRVVFAGETTHEEPNGVSVDVSPRSAGEDTIHVSGTNSSG
jgi:hypothetical protein